MAFTKILPDPTHTINAAGQSSPFGIGGPGYAAIKLSSRDEMMSSRYNSQRYDSQSNSYHTWVINISYNPLTCEEFHIIFAFLGFMRSSMEPFYVSVPPYEAQSLIGLTLNDTGYKKDETILVNGTGAAPGMIFNFAGNSKIYKITRVETSTLNDTAVAAGKERLHITPPMQSDVVYNTALNFLDPLFKVEQAQNEANYSINKDGLFEFSLQLEEVS